ncbi:MAG: hypothetical protein GC192_24625 [Bacteroidetes bacterium]|nr:hypothetical protein [Bacteroidota bacterium]
MNKKEILTLIDIGAKFQTGTLRDFIPIFKAFNDVLSMLTDSLHTAKVQDVFWRGELEILLIKFSAVYKM